MKSILLFLLILISTNLFSQIDQKYKIIYSKPQTLNAVLIYKYSVINNTMISQIIIKNTYYKFFSNSNVNCEVINKNDTLKFKYPDFKKWCFSFFEIDGSKMIADSQFYFRSNNQYGYLNYYSNCFYTKSIDDSCLYISFNARLAVINYFNFFGERIIVLDYPIFYKRLTKKQEKKLHFVKLNRCSIKQDIAE